METLQGRLGIIIAGGGTKPGATGYSASLRFVILHANLSQGFASIVVESTKINLSFPYFALLFHSLLQGGSRVGRRGIFVAIIGSEGRLGEGTRDEARAELRGIRPAIKCQSR